MRTTWKQYLESVAYEDPIEYFKEQYDGSEKIARLAVILAGLPSDADLSERYNIITNIDEIPFGQFIACERAVSMGLPMQEALKILAQNVLRPKSDEEFDNTDPIKEQKHLDMLDEEAAADITSVLNKFSSLRKNYVHRTYNGVFYKEYQEPSEDEEEDDTPPTAEERYAKNWYWYVIMREIANQDIFRYEQVLMLPMSVITPELAYRRHTQRMEEIERKRNEQLNRIKNRR